MKNLVERFTSSALLLALSLNKETRGVADPYL
jgi:hypothetical protein